jgi:hypothetical protein
MFLTIEAFKKQYFGDSRHPSLSTLRRLADKGELPSRRVGKRYFIDSIAFEAAGNATLEKVLRDVARAA